MTKGTDIESALAHLIDDRSRNTENCVADCKRNQHLKATGFKQLNILKMTLTELETLTFWTLLFNIWHIGEVKVDFYKTTQYKTTPGAKYLFRYVINQPPKANSAFYPSGVGKWVPASAKKAKAGMVHSVSGWTRGVQVKLWHPLRMRAIPERLRGVIMTRRYTNPCLPYL